MKSIKAMLAATVAVLALAVTAALPTPAWADDTPAATMSGDCSAAGDGSITWALTQNEDGSTYTFTISGEGAMRDWNEHRASGSNACGTDATASPDFCTVDSCELNRPWIAYLDSITEVKISEGITRLGSCSFTRMSKVESLELPSTLEVIGFGSLANMTSLETLTIPDNVNSIETSGLYGDSALTTLTFSDKGKLESIGNFAFSGLAISGEVDLPEGLKTIGRCIFESCRKITKLTIPSSVESYVLNNGVNSIFNNGADSLTSVVINSTADLPGYMFQGARQLETVELASGTKSIGVSAFNNCTALTSITGTDQLETVGEQAFRYDGALATIDLSSAKTIGAWSFNKTGLTSIDLPSATSIDRGAFNDCPNLVSITAEGSPSIPSGIISGDPALLTVDLTGVSSVANMGSGALTYWQQQGQFTAIYLSDNDMTANAEKTFRTSGSRVIFASTNGGVLSANANTATMGTLATPVRPGYKFAGWYKDQDFKTEYTNGVVESDLDNPNKRYTRYYAYAKWEPKDEQKINFEHQGTTKHVSDETFREALIGAKTDVTYKSSDENVATVDTDGTITIVGPGQATITATAAETDDYASAETTLDITVTDHQWDEGTVTQEATCIVNGSKEFKCTVAGCGATKTEEIDATGHKWADEATVDREATCTEDGQKSVHCMACDAINPDSVEAIPATDHDLSYKHNTIDHWQACSKGDYKSDPEEHNFGDWTVTKEATATEDGERTHTCKVCGYTATEAVPATGNQAGKADQSGATTTTDAKKTSSKASKQDAALPSTGDDSPAAMGAIAAMGVIVISAAAFNARRRNN